MTLVLNDASKARVVFGAALYAASFKDVVWVWSEQSLGGLATLARLRALHVYMGFDDVEFDFALVASVCVDQD